MKNNILFSFLFINFLASGLEKDHDFTSSSSRQNSDSSLKCSKREMASLIAAYRDSFLRGDLSEREFLLKLQGLQNDSKKTLKMDK